MGWGILKMRKESELARYRHEDKYIVDGMQNALLKTRIRALMKTDGNAGEAGCYRVRSLYFDSPRDQCYYENESGIGERDKYRIRIYNGSADRIFLEKKSKSRQMTLKQSCPVSEGVCRRLMAGEQTEFSPELTQKQRQLLSEIWSRAMRPVVIVEYLRYPFVEANGNVRITFDEAISSSNDISGFLEEEIPLRPVLDRGMSVFEVKWDEFLPGYIKNHLQLDSLQWTSFSKYYLCRKYNGYGGIRI